MRREAGTRRTTLDLSEERDALCDVMTKPLNRIVAVWWMSVILWGGALQTRAATAEDATNPAPVSLGDNTYSLTRGSGFVAFRGTEGLAYRARQDAEKFCADMGKQMKLVSLKEDKASLLKGGFSKATIVFQAVTAGEAGEAGVASQSRFETQPERGAAPRADY